MSKYDSGRCEYMQREPLTVRKLVELLLLCNPDEIVSSEGCDCTEEAYGIERYSGDSVVIRRKEDYAVEHPKTMSYVPLPLDDADKAAIEALFRA